MFCNVFDREILLSNRILLTKSHESFNLVPGVVSDPLFQSPSQMTTLAQGVVFVGVFETADIRFRMSNTLLVIAISPFRFLNG